MSDMKHGRTYFYIATGALALAAVAAGLAFVPPLGVYSLIAAILLELAALAFLSSQKKRQNFKGVLVVTVVAYVMLALCAAFFTGGIICNALLTRE